MLTGVLQLYELPHALVNPNFMYVTIKCLLAYLYYLFYYRMMIPLYLFILVKTDDSLASIYAIKG